MINYDTSGSPKMKLYIFPCGVDRYIHHHNPEGNHGEHATTAHEALTALWDILTCNHLFTLSFNSTS